MLSSDAINEDRQATFSFLNKQTTPLGANLTKTVDYCVNWHKFDYCCIDVLPHGVRWRVLNKVELHVSCSKFFPSLFQAIWWTSISALTNIKTRSKSSFPWQIFHSSYKTVVTGNHTVTQHHWWNKQVELIGYCINGKMNEPVLENSMFNHDKSYELVTNGHLGWFYQNI